MQVAQSEELRRRWGNKSCPHRYFEQEYYLGTPTGQYACTVCGKTSPYGDRAKNKPGHSPGN